MKNISVFKNFTKEMGTRTLSEIVLGIRGAHYKEAIFQIRKAVGRGDKEAADKLKKGLLAFTVSGVFSGGRRMEFLKAYNPFVILDIDKLEADIVNELLEKINGIPFTRVSFISPSGRGIKIIVQVNSDQEEHWLAYKQVVAFYESELGIEIDTSGKDITRLCFMSHDPSAYFDPKSEVFEVSESEEAVLDSMLERELDTVDENIKNRNNKRFNLAVDMNSAFAECVSLTNQKFEFKKGNRNNYIYELAVNCRNAGIPFEVTDRLSKVGFNLSDKEIEQTVRSAYNWKPKKRYVKSEHQEIPTDVPPSIPSDVFSKLPNLLQKGCGRFKDEKERDVFLTGALGVLSGCLPNVKGTYDGNVCYPNLYVFVIAPAASGKGALKFSKMLGMGYHKQLLEKSRQDQEEYKRALLAFELTTGKYKKGKVSELPKEPKEVPFKTLFIPANSSSAMLVRHLYHNNDSGILFESEADTLGNVLKQDWGGYSDLLRKAYHHEPISYSRKQNSEFVEIAEPKLSVALSGTPGQVTSLIPSTEDGLFSRFLFYAFEVDAKWRDVSPAGRGKNFQDLFQASLSNEVIAMVNFLKKHPMNFGLASEQWKSLNQFFEKLVEETISLVGKEALSIVRRSGLMMFRIAMILSAIRKYEEQNISEPIVCQADDFEAAFSLVETYFKHSFFMFDRLPKRVKNTFQFKNVKKQLFYDALPDRFFRKEALTVCPQINISERTAVRYLKELLQSGYLSQSTDGKYGEYFKVTVS